MLKASPLPCRRTACPNRLVDQDSGLSSRISSRVPYSKRQANGIVGKAIWFTRFQPIPGVEELPSGGEQYSIEPENDADRQTVEGPLFTAEELDVLSS